MTMKADQLRRLLTQAGLCGIYHLPSSEIDALCAAAESLDYRCFKVSFRESDDIGDALVECGRSLGFPEWYGANLDALSDCLTDLSWNEASGYIIIISQADALHARGEPFRQINQVLSNAIHEWQKQNIPFWIFYDIRSDGLATLPTLA